jgi:hypothetical protein
MHARHGHPFQEDTVCEFRDIRVIENEVIGEDAVDELQVFGNAFR